MNVLLKKERSLEAPPPVEDLQINLLRGQPRRGYGRAFWLAYLSNFLISVAVSILYRYADFVRLLGGSEYQLGWIVGVGMIGSLTARLTLGSGIDRRGPKAIWLVSLAAFCVICFAHLGLTRPDTPVIYLLRVAYCLAVAGVFGAAMTFVSGRMPVVRMAEMIGMLGTAGFMGMVVGAQVGDWLCGAEQLTRAHVDRLFTAAGLIGLGAMLFAALATGQSPPPQVRHRQPPMGYLLRRYQPGAILGVALVAGAGLGWPSTFLATYAAELGIPRIGAFFTIYSITAVITRVLTRRWPESFGLTPLVLIGLAIIGGSQLLFLFVQNEWTFMLPGFTYGIGHAILFPTVVATGCRTFPERYRGLGTMLIMSAFDLGTMVGSPLVGTVLHRAPEWGLPGYPSLFVLMGVLLGGTAVVYRGIAAREQTVPSSRRGIRRAKAQPARVRVDQAAAEPLLPPSKSELGPGPSSKPSVCFPACAGESAARRCVTEPPSREIGRESREKSPAKQPIHQAG